MHKIIKVSWMEGPCVNEHRDKLDGRVQVCMVLSNREDG